MNWRSLLYVPANVAAYLAKAQTRGADALIFDLEDSVPPDAKATARNTLDVRWEGLRAGPADLLVRINAPLRDAVRDLEAVVRPGLSALYLPKIKGPEHVHLLAETVLELEHAKGMTPGSVGLVPIIETPAALDAAYQIAAASPRVIALTLGGEDLATACRMEPTPEALRGPRQRIVMAARSAGIDALGLLDSPANLDTDALPHLAARSRQFGFDGAAVVHPGAVEAVTAGFSPNDSEVAEAKAILAAMQDAATQGRGAARHNGRMLDRAMQTRAEQTLARRRR